jgi:hypothetical protein
MRWTRRLRARLRRPAVAYADVRSLRRPVAVARVVRIVLAVTIAALLAGAIVAASHAGRSRSTIVPQTQGNVLVIDLSKSILDTAFPTIGATLRRLIATDTPTGLIMFSDVPYELLPPGSPASSLVPILRYFTPVNGSYPANPWGASFRAGTRISSALELASQMLARSAVERGSIVLVSDLQTAPSDVASLTQTLVSLRRQHVLVRAVPLGASDLSKQQFGSVLGPDYLLPAPRAVADQTTRIHRTLEGQVSVPLLVLSALLLVALAANERWCARLAITGAAVPRTEQ